MCVLLQLRVALRLPERSTARGSAGTGGLDNAGRMSEWEDAGAREMLTSADVACEEKGAGVVYGARGEHSSGARRHAPPTPVQHRHEWRLLWKEDKRGVIWVWADGREREVEICCIILVIISEIVIIIILFCMLKIHWILKYHLLFNSNINCVFLFYILITNTFSIWN